MAARVPTDIMYDILLSLPAKSLFRFKCVCKAWKNMIESFDFIKSHLNRSIETKSNCFVLFVTPISNSLYQLHDLHSLSYSPTTKLSFHKPCRDHRVSKLIGSCNGLICVFLDNKDLALCNPSTRAFQPVPQCYWWNPRYGSYGFVYDRESDDYKIVNMLREDVWVYSMRANSWSHHPKPRVESESNYFDVKHGMFANHFHRIIDGRKIHTFDFHDMVWGRVLSLPACVKNNNDYRKRLWVLDGCLYLTSSFAYSGNYEMWVMKEYGVVESWTKLFSFKGQAGIPVEYCENPNGVLFAKMHRPGLSQYNLWQKTQIEVPEMNDSSLIWRVDCFYQMQLCVESLVPLMGNHKLRAKES